MDNLTGSLEIWISSDLLPVSIAILLLTVLWICVTGYMSHKLYGSNKENAQEAGHKIANHSPYPQFRSKSSNSPKKRGTHATAMDPRLKQLTMSYLVSYTIFNTIMLTICCLVSTEHIDIMRPHQRHSSDAAHISYWILCVLASFVFFFGFFSLYRLLIWRVFVIFQPTAFALKHSTVSIYSGAAFVASLLLCFWG